MLKILNKDVNKTNGIVSVFCIKNGIDPGNYMLVNWDNIKLNIVTTWGRQLKQYGCP